jgi:Flp pilus assembly protein TadG
VTTTRRQRGVAIVEFALVLPLLLVMTFITTEFGRAVYQYNTLAKSVRDAARYLSIQTPNSHITEARNLVVYGNTAGTGDPLVLGLTTSHVATPEWATAGTDPVIGVVTVRITGYTFNSLMAQAFGLTLGAVTFSDIRATMPSALWTPPPTAPV